MRHMRRGAIASLAAVSVVVWLALPLVPAGAAGKQTGHGKGHGDTFELAPDVHDKIHKNKGAVVNAAANATPEVGAVRTWLGLDDAEGFYPKNYQLRGVGDRKSVV